MATVNEALVAFKAKQDEFNRRLSTSIDGISKDIDGLNAKIKQLQDNPGPITPADQAILDSMETDGLALASKVEAVDDLTPPPPPVVDPNAPGGVVVDPAAPAA